MKTMLTIFITLCTATIMMSSATLAEGACVPRSPNRGRQWKTNGPTYQNVTYVTNADPDLGASQKMDIYTSSAAFEANAPPAPVIVFVHGGGWRQGDKFPCQSYFKDMRKLGFHVVSVNYRLSWQAVWPAQIDDVENAIRYLKDNKDTYNLDPEKIIIIGSSAGGHLASLVGTRNGPESDARVLGTVDFYGPPVLYAKNESDQISAMLNCTNMAEEGTPCNALAIEASPYTHVNANNPPFLILQGTEDPTTPPEGSKMFHEALLNVGINSILILAKGAGHNKGEVLARTTLGKSNELLMQKWMHILAKDCVAPRAPAALIAEDTMGNAAVQAHTLATFSICVFIFNLLRLS